jgi:hypothetical protein
MSPIPLAKWMPQLEPGHRPPAALPPPPPRRQARNQLKPRPPSAPRPARDSSGTPGPLRSVTSTRTRPSPALTATVTVPPAAPDRLCRTLLPNSSPAGRRHPRTGARDRAPRLRTRGRPAPAPPARPPSRSPGSAAQPSAHPPSPAARPGKSPGRWADARGCTLNSAAHVKPEHVTGAALSVAVRGKPTVHTDRPGGRTPSAICPWTPRHSALQRYKVAHDGTEKKRPASTRIRS